MSQSGIVDHKLSFGVIGIGNAGSQIAALAKTQLGLDAIALNSAEQDASQVEGIEVLIIGDGNGTARNREFAKQQFLLTVEENIKNVGIGRICSNDIVFVVASTGGGTGSGLSPSVYKILRAKYGNTTDFVFVGILPFEFEDNDTKINSVDCLNEFVTKIDSPTYSLFSNASAGISEHKGIAKINKEVIDYFYILMGKTEIQTELVAIDDQELRTLIRTPGRLVTVNVTKNISKFDVPIVNGREYLNGVIKDVLKNTHQVFDYSDTIIDENIANRIGVIIHLEPDVADSVDYAYIKSVFGQPISMFQHTSIKSSPEFDSNISIIASGLGIPTIKLGALQKDIRHQMDIEAARNARDMILGVDIKSAKDLKKIPSSKGTSDESLTEMVKGFI